MKILIDESLPRQLKHFLGGHEADTVQEAGWAGVKNGELLAKAEGEYFVFLTTDRNLWYQQNMRGRKLALVIFPTNKLSVIRALQVKLELVLSTLGESEIVELSLPDREE